MSSMSTFFLVAIVAFAISNSEASKLSPKSPSSCGKFGRDDACASKCPVKCSNRFEPPPTCPHECVKGCVCNPGYIIDDGNNNVCIKRKACKR